MHLLLITDKQSDDMDGSKEVIIDGEKYNLDVVPAADSKVVVKEKEKLLRVVDLKTIVDDLGHAGAFIRVAYNGVKAAGPRYTELQIEIQELGYEITKLCDESALTVSGFEMASATVLDDLEATYRFLLRNQEAIAIETLSSVSKLAGEMEKAALALHDKFEKQEIKVRNTLKKTQTVQGEAAIRIEEKEIEHQQLQIQLQHQQELLDDAKRLEHEAEANRRQIEAKENEAISSIKHIGPLKSMFNAIFGYEVFDEGTKKLDCWKEKHIQALENESKVRKQRYEAMEGMTTFAVMIQNCQSEQEMATVAVDALHKTVDALKELITAVMQAATFWRQMQKYCRRLSSDRIKVEVKIMQEEVSKDERMKMWTSGTFKKQAIHFYAGWVALNSLCSDYVEHIKETRKDLYEYIKENPTYKESRKNIHELAKQFLTDIKKDQDEMAKKDLKAQEEIKALTQD